MQVVFGRVEPRNLGSEARGGDGVHAPTRVCELGSELDVRFVAARPVRVAAGLFEGATLGGLDKTLDDVLHRGVAKEERRALTAMAMVPGRKHAR